MQYGWCALGTFRSALCWPLHASKPPLTVTPLQPICASYLEWPDDAEQLQHFTQALLVQFQFLCCHRVTGALSGKGRWGQAPAWKGVCPKVESGLPARQGLLGRACCNSCNFFFAVNVRNKKTVTSCNIFFFAVSRVSRLTRLTAKKNYTT